MPRVKIGWCQMSAFGSAMCQYLVLPCVSIWWYLVSAFGSAIYQYLVVPHHLLINGLLIATLAPRHLSRHITCHHDQVILWDPL